MDNAVGWYTHKVVWPSWLFPEHFHPPKQTCRIYWPSFPILPPSSPWQTLIYFIYFQIWLSQTCHVHWLLQIMALCVWFLSLSVRFSRFLHVVACGRPRPVSELNRSRCESATFCWSPTRRHLGHLHFLAITNKTAMDSVNKCFAWTYILHYLG